MFITTICVEAVGSNALKPGEELPHPTRWGMLEKLLQMLVDHQRVLHVTLILDNSKRSNAEARL